MIDTATPPHVLSSTYAPVPVAPTRIRLRLRALFAAWRLRPEAVDDALLVVEELVANALDHAESPFELVVRLDGDVLHVAVRDGSTELPRIRSFDPHARRGRGLQMVAALSQRWGWESHGDGKTMWAELAV